MLDNKLSQMLDVFNKLISEHPEFILKPDPELIKLADGLVEGVEVNNV